MVGHSNLASLGKPNMGVYISKHADIVRFTKWEDRLTGYIIMLKIMKVCITRNAHIHLITFAVT